MGRQMFALNVVVDVGGLALCATVQALPQPYSGTPQHKKRGASTKKKIQKLFLSKRTFSPVTYQWTWRYNFARLYSLPSTYPLKIENLAHSVLKLKQSLGAPCLCPSRSSLLESVHRSLSDPKVPRPAAAQLKKTGFRRSAAPRICVPMENEQLGECPPMRESRNPKSANGSEAQEGNSTNQKSTEMNLNPCQPYCQLTNRYYIIINNYIVYISQ